jgi:hypothetical protein
MKIEYKVRPITRYVVTRYEQSDCGRVGNSTTKGEYDNANVAHEVAYALCSAEHEALGWDIADERIQYPRPENLGVQVGFSADNVSLTQHP